MIEMCYCNPSIRTPMCGSIECRGIAEKLGTFKTETDSEKEDLINLSKELLSFADKMSFAPYYVCQPTLGIIRRYRVIIDKYNLFGEENG